ncbi:hypothetical protein BS50DRAFT_234907 [Corynespora cassiicola Philippines]|uniref:Uncharacterized protein n=1 Tax=Corynespora cassiicola Philippines TaxID=1448308 RepID=A0A2T2P217_CORCC|nr:hypothetical protein BS50DRAFT_234907 [Corynespora cassiicola Philippines]
MRLSIANGMMNGLSLILEMRNSWSLKLPFGTIGIKTETKTRRMHGSIRFKSYLSLHIHFRPSKSFVFVPGVSIFHGHTLRNTGHITLSASINFHKIIPYNHPVWEVIRKDDVSALQQMIQFGSVDLGAEFPNGYKLLHGWNDSENQLKLTATSLVTIGFLLPLNVFDNYTTYRQNRAQIIAHLRQENVKQAFQQWFPHSYFDGGNIFVAFQNERAHYFSDLYKVIGDEIGHFVNTVAYRGGWDLYGPSICSLEMVSEMIDHGLNPNLDIKVNHHSIPSLYAAIRLMHCTNNSNGSVQGGGYDGTDGRERRNAETSKSGPQHSSDADDQVTPWCIVVALIQAGADIHHMVPWTIEGAQRWTDIQTPWWLASQLGKSGYWREALFEYGLDPISTWREDMKRRKQALRLRGAWRSGIDEQILDLPSSTGLRNRWCHRKQHSCWAIGYQAEWH